MNIWLAGLLAVLIVAGGAVVFILACALLFGGGAKLLLAIENRLGEKRAALVGHGIMLAVTAAGFGVAWYGVLAWLMGWPL